MRTAVQGVQGIAVVGGDIDVLDDVDLTVVWPDGALRPECWPYRALTSYLSGKHIEDHTTRGRV